MHDDREPMAFDELYSRGPDAGSSVATTSSKTVSASAASYPPWSPSRVTATRNRKSLRKTDVIRTPQPSPPTAPAMPIHPLRFSFKAQRELTTTGGDGLYGTTTRSLPSSFL